MQAKFKTKTYECFDVRQSNANDGANALTLVLTDVEDINELIEEATGCDLIEILNGGVVTQIYEDYIKFMSEAMAGDSVEVSVCQPSLVQQVLTLKATVKAQAQTIAEQEAIIAQLETSQAQQDEDIEGLGDAIVEMSEIVYE